LNGNGFQGIRDTLMVLQHENASLVERIHDLEAGRQEQAAAITELKQIVLELQAENCQLQGEVKALRCENIELRQQHRGDGI
jgi:uncharacterized coiled-coil protein SlyX